jgi:DNA-binding transcriptional MocR family regulator
LQAIHELLQQHAPQAWLLLDETYREAAYGDEAAADTGLQLGPRVISVSSLSKCHGAPGLRIGWAITRDTALREQLVAAKFNTVISCSPLDEALALRALQRRHELVGALRRRLAGNLAIVADWVQRHAECIEWVRPDAGALCCVRLKPEVYDEAAVERFHAALSQEGARVGDGRWFGESSRVFRLGFGLPGPEELPPALQAVSRALARAVGSLPCVEGRTA